MGDMNKAKEGKAGWMWLEGQMGNGREETKTEWKFYG